MLIPDNISDFESTGERLLYNKFKYDNSTNGMYILHSLFTNYHLKNISGELDFLVLAPNQGIFAIEVKHGSISRKDGTWYFTNRQGAITKKKKSPFAQVNSTMNSIRTYVLQKVKNNQRLHNRFSKILWDTGVAFTSMNELIDLGTESNSWQILTREGLFLPIGYYIDSLTKGSHNKNSDKYWYDVNSARPTDADCKTLLKILRGDFDINYLEVNRILDLDKVIEEFTKEQFNLLDFINFNDRCIIEGAAGTGKTLMAIEVLKKETSKDKKVALFCYNKKLGIKLSNAVKKLFTHETQHCVGGSFHSYLVKNCKISIPKGDETITQKFFEEDLPFEFILQNEEIAEKDKFDFLILDEAQDLITSYYLDVIDHILKGGLKNGKWVLFGDFSNQAIYRSDFESTLNHLKQTTTFTRFPPLTINCRNTHKIAIQNTLLTGIKKPQFNSTMIGGDSIINKFPTYNSQVQVIEGILKTLQSKEVPLANITLLSPKRIENSILNTSEYVKYLMQQGVEVSTIHSYKGLENSIILLFDFDEINSIESQRLLYVGISRAKQQLYIVFKKKLEIDYQNLIKQNLEKYD